MRTKILALLLFLAPLAFAQNPGVVIVGTAPSGACSQGVAGRLVNSTGAIWTCQSIVSKVGTWTLETGGGGGSPAGSAGDLQTYATSSTFGAAHLNDNGTTITTTETITPLVAAAKNLGT